MDQRQLYDRADPEPADPEPAKALNPVRPRLDLDRFVVGSLRKIRVGGQLKIAELSIGDGHMTEAMLRGLREARLTCADISTQRVDRLKLRLAGETTAHSMPEFVVCNFDTDFDCLPSEEFDAIVAIDILEHVLDVFGFLEGCRRIAKQGGYIYLRVPNIAYVRHRVNLLRGRMPITASWFGTPDKFSAWRRAYGWDGGHLHLFTLPHIHKLLTESGFAVISSNDPSARFAALRNCWPTLLFANPVVVGRKQ